MMEPIANFAHQEDIFDPKHARGVTIFGAGSIASCVALLLTKMGVTDIEVWDGKTVSSHNAPMSLYRQRDMGRLKVEALREHIEYLTGVTITINPQYYCGEKISRRSVIVSSVDDMDVRKEIWRNIKGRIGFDLLCDTRIAAAYGEVLSVCPLSLEDQENYEPLLYRNEEALRPMCGNHGVIYNSFGTAVMVASNIARYWQTGHKEWRKAMRHDTLESVF